MNRAEFQALAELRVREAEALLAAGLWDGAYYLAGYAVECGLKACIAKLTRAENFPPNRKFVDACYSHKLAELVDTAGLEDERKALMKSAPVFSANWDVVKDWSEQSRYERVSENRARQLIAAITSASGGVLPWIKTRW